MLHFDEAGLRVPSEEYRHDLDTPTLILGGGSFTMGHGLPYEDSFAGRLAAMPDFQLQLVNLGVQAYGTDQALLDAVVVTFTGEQSNPALRAALAPATAPAISALLSENCPVAAPATVTLCRHSLGTKQARSGS